MSTGDKFCPYFQQAAELIGRRWAGAVLRALLAGPLRFSEIERAIRQISARALAQRLRELEAAGLVVRGVDTGTPVHVSYRLTEKGRALEDVVARIERWAHDWLAPRGVHAHRNFCARPKPQRLDTSASHPLRGRARGRRARGRRRYRTDRGSEVFA